jgi:hypothetical protein
MVRVWVWVRGSLHISYCIVLYMYRIVAAILSYRIVSYLCFVQNLPPMVWVWHSCLVMVSFLFLTVTMVAPYWTQRNVLDEGAISCKVYNGPWGCVYEGCKSYDDGYREYRSQFESDDVKKMVEWRGDHYDPQLFSPSLLLIPLLSLPLPSAFIAPPPPTPPASHFQAGRLLRFSSACSPLWQRQGPGKRGIFSFVVKTLKHLVRSIYRLFVNKTKSSVMPFSKYIDCISFLQPNHP